MAVIAIAECSVDWINTHKHGAVNHVTDDTQARQSACLEAISVRSCAAQNGIVTQIGANKKMQVPCRTADLQDL
ncbi:hypothetical protein [Paucibacter sp. Y2R2-4]|uniref:hypothetical protein n=1 Tax=Paucibacter sp. Y2R2-4 TaxID=2893553 RepID=UPI0021E39EB7|nr:hypothetical protein [Paucibacter sp. Y2R2-4]MCV2351099.1 hypothetical protein [Paucibacter sp. Y2R2-4]